MIKTNIITVQVEVYISKHYVNQQLAYRVVLLLAKSSADVIIRTHDSIVSSSSSWCLEECVNHTLSSGDVLLVIGFVKSKAFPFVLVGLLILLNLCNNLEAPIGSLGVGDSWGHFLQAAAQKGRAGNWSTSTSAVQAQLLPHIPHSLMTYSYNENPTLPEQVKDILVRWKPHNSA